MRIKTWTTHHGTVVSKVRITVGVGHGVRRHRLTILHPNLGGLLNTEMTICHSGTCYTITHELYIQCREVSGVNEHTSVAATRTEWYGEPAAQRPSPRRPRPKASRVMANQTSRYQTDIPVIRSARCVYILYSSYNAIKQYGND